MGYTDIANSRLKSVRWQDYRGTKDGVLVYFVSSSLCTNAVRDITDESGKGSLQEPNIETGTYGFLHCVDARTRNSFFKNKKGYLFFATKYQGKEKKYKDRDFIIGYYKINKIADVRRQHLRNYGDAELCPSLDHCYALRADEFKFVNIEDAFELTSGKMKEWGYKGNVVRQLRLSFNEEKVDEILAHFSSKKDASEKYIKDIETLMDMDNEDEEDDE